MAQLGLFQSVARIYTNTPEAQTILQQLRELFQDAEEKMRFHRKMLCGVNFLRMCNRTTQSII